MKRIPIASSEVMHAVLTDIQKNNGSTRAQVQYRLKVAPGTINRIIDFLISQGKILYLDKTGKMVITPEGIKSL
jgi:hypothetical protein